MMLMMTETIWKRPTNKRFWRQEEAFPSTVSNVRLKLKIWAHKVLELEGIQQAEEIDR